MMQCSRVDLPEPDAPMIAVNCLAGMSRVTDRRALTSVVADPYVLVRSRVRTALAEVVREVAVAAAVTEADMETPVSRFNNVSTLGELSLVTHQSREWFRHSYRRRMLPVYGNIPGCLKGQRPGRTRPAS